MNVIEQVEKEFAARFNKKHGVMMCNGTATLHCCLLAAGVGPGDEVIVPALTMASPALAVRYCGAKVVYADVHEKSFCLDVYRLPMFSPGAKAIILVGLYGQPANTAQFVGGYLNEEIGWVSCVIEDNAQCLTSECCFGDMFSFSFQSTKHITTGEGGMVLTNNEALARKLRQFSNLGYSWPIEKDWITRPDVARHNVIGYNYRPSEAQAKLLLKEMPLMKERVRQRYEVAQLYRSVCEGREILLPQADSDFHSYWCFAAYLREGYWNDFVHLFRANGGDRVYGAWRLPYQEPALYDDTQHCPVAERLQPKMLQFKTNYTDMKKAQEQAQGLKKTLEEFRP